MKQDGNYFAGGGFPPDNITVSEFLQIFSAQVLSLPRRR